MTDMNQANQRFWDALAPDWNKLREQDQLWQQCPQHPELAFDGEALAMIRESMGDLRGKHICVIASGDNYVAFALAGMGAHVTSTDISARQLETGRWRAVELGLEITFLQADATRLEEIGNNQFDLVCSSNGFFVWIAEPAKVFQQVCRVLKPGGFYIFYDVHPFQRPWVDQKLPLEMEKPYWETGPYSYFEYDETSYQFNWRMSDLLNPMLDAGLLLRRIAESPAKDARFWEGEAYTPGKDTTLTDWHNNPRAGLPAWLTVAAQKTKR